MSEAESKRPSEETIVAVDPRIVRPEAVAVVLPRRNLLMPALAAAVLVILLGVVFFALPRWVAEEPEAANERVAAVAPVVPAEPTGPQLSEEELAALEAEAESLLAELIPQQARLDELSAEIWGGEQWARYQALGREGDDTYLADDFAAAVTAYRDALAAGEALLENMAEIIATALAAASQAIEAGNAALATEQYEIVLGIEPGNSVALAGRARAETLPEVIALTQAGEAERGAGELTAAIESYRAALAIDPAWAPARRALDAVTAELSGARFDRLMSSGFSALAAEDYDEAAEHFRAALTERPSSTEARDGLIEAEQGMQLDQIALVEVRALAFEARELWQRAIDQYRAALATDPTLAFANQGLARSQQRADLDAKLVNLIEHPDLLLEDRVLSEAERLVAEARPLAAPDTRLSGQLAELERLMRLATTPIPVELTSDQATEVTLFRVGELGIFAAKEVRVRPGTYTVVGSRRGYRDVRQTFTVLPGREPPRVHVVCVEPI